MTRGALFMTRGPLFMTRISIRYGAEAHTFAP